MSGRVEDTRIEALLRRLPYSANCAINTWLSNYEQKKTRRYLEVLQDVIAQALRYIDELEL